MHGASDSTYRKLELAILGRVIQSCIFILQSYSQIASRRLTVFPVTFISKAFLSQKYFVSLAKLRGYLGHRIKTPFCVNLEGLREMSTLFQSHVELATSTLLDEGAMFSDSSRQKEGNFIDSLEIISSPPQITEDQNNQQNSE